MGTQSHQSPMRNIQPPSLAEVGWHLSRLATDIVVEGRKRGGRVLRLAVPFFQQALEVVRQADGPLLELRELAEAYGNTSTDLAKARAEVAIAGGVSEDYRLTRTVLSVVDDPVKRVQVWLRLVDATDGDTVRRCEETIVAVREAGGEHYSLYLEMSRRLLEQDPDYPIRPSAREALRKLQDPLDQAKFYPFIFNCRKEQHYQDFLRLMKDGFPIDQVELATLLCANTGNRRDFDLAVELLSSTIVNRKHEASRRLQQAVLNLIIMIEGKDRELVVVDAGEEHEDQVLDMEIEDLLRILTEPDLKARAYAAMMSSDHPVHSAACREQAIMSIQAAEEARVHSSLIDKAQLALAQGLAQAWEFSLAEKAAERINDDGPFLLAKAAIVRELRRKRESKS